MTLRIGSLCSGYEGLGAAVQSVMGGELAWVADNDPGAAAILAYRFPSLPNLGDISAADWSAVEPVDVLTAGFPCQDVSCAGGRAGLREGNRTGVWAYVARAIGELRPPLVVLENVRGLLTFGADSNLEPCPWCMGDSGDESVLRACGAVLADLADLGFDAEWALVPAAEVGAPHRRERIFILAWPAADAAGGRPHGSQDARAGSGDAVTRLWSAKPQRGSRERTPAPDTDRAACGERRITAPGETESGGSRTDAGGRGGAPAADTERGDRDGRAVEPLGGPHRRDAADRDSAGRSGRLAAADPIGPELPREREPERREPAPSGDHGSPIEWGLYTLAIRRWERVIGRPAPRPTEPGRTGERLNPRFVEWMMGLPDGWVTDVPGLSRNAQLKALGNGVVPQQAAMALRLLLERAGIAPLAAAEGAA